MGFITRDITVGFQFFLSIGGFAAMSISLLWLLGMLLENHKRFIIYFVCCRKKEKREEIDPEDLVQDDVDPEIVPHREKNVWNLLDWLFCSMKIIAYPKYNVVVRPVSIWRALFLTLGIVFIVIFGIIKFWVAIAVLCLLYLGIILDYILPFLIFIPEHKPSYERMNAAWDMSYMQRYIAILEEGYYQSPSVAFSFFKSLLLGTISLAIICAVLGMYQIVYALSIPLSFSLFSIILYVFRFNFTCRKKKSVEETPLFEKNDAHLHVSHESPYFRILSVLYVSITIPAICIIFLVLYFSVLGWTTGLFVLVWLVLFGFFLFKRYDRESAKAQAVFFWILLVLMGVIFLVGNAKQPESESKSYARIGRLLPPMRNPYAICSKRWHGMSVIDYGFLSNLAYQSEPYFSQDLQTLFPNFTDAQVVYTYNLTASFYDLYIPSKNLSVIAVRGTHLLIDLIQDLHIWKEIALLQFSSYIGPFVSFWPERMTATIIYAVSLLEDLSVASDDNQAYYTPLEGYVTSILGKRNIILTGHSLGGGLANIVGSRLEIPTVSFSPPGISFTRMKLGLTLEKINSMCTNILPDYDVVTKIDKNGGLVQHIDCDQDFTKCHSVQTTIMALIKSCGSDPLGRYLID